MKKIVYADDCESILRSASLYFKDMGYDISVAADGKEALNLIHKLNSLDLLITDIEMPNMDGYTLINKLNQEGYKFPIFVKAFDFDAFKVKYLGKLEYFPKLGSAKEFFQKAAELLEGK